MGLEDQPVLLEMPEQPVPEPRPDEGKGPIKLKPIDRTQTVLANIYVEELIGADHKARAIWELAGRLDLNRFAAPLKTREGTAGRAAWDPRLLVSIWVYAYSEGIGSAREIERSMEWEPALEWLSGMQTINHHTLSDFRVEHKEALDELFTQLLGMLQAAGALSLDRVMHDGTKIRAQAGADTFRREKTLRQHLEEARGVVAAMGDPRGEPHPRDRREAARERAARERKQRLEAALREMETLSAASPRDKEKPEPRVSETEPEARLMKHGDNAIAPSYNAQLTTTADHKIIVNASLTQSSSDAASLMPSLEQVEARLEEMPRQVVADGGFTNRASIVACAKKNIDLVGSLPDPQERSAASARAAGIDAAFAAPHFRILTETRQLECPAGCLLDYVRQSRKRGDVYQQYQARASACSACPEQAKCCPHSAPKGRTVSIRAEEQAEVAAFRSKMQDPAYQAIYKQRGPVAEFPHAWIKEKIGLRKFRVRGILKAGCELLWACLTYNLMQYLRVRRATPVLA